MLDRTYQGIVQSITEKAEMLLLEKRVSEGIKQIDYAAIFPKSEEEHAGLLDALSKDGIPIKIFPKGTVFKLNQPIQTQQGDIALVKLRIFDPAKTKLGYIDYDVEDYQNFKRSYLSTSAVDVTENAEGQEMLMIEDPEFFLYFPESPFGLDYI